MCRAKALPSISMEYRTFVIPTCGNTKSGSKSKSHTVEGLAWRSDLVTVIARGDMVEEPMFPAMTMSVGGPLKVLF